MKTQTKIKPRVHRKYVENIVTTIPIVYKPKTRA